MLLGYYNVTCKAEIESLYECMYKLSNDANRKFCLASRLIAENIFDVKLLINLQKTNIKNGN